MTVNVSKPVVNVREKLAELDKPTGIAGEAMLRAETPQEQFNLIGAGRRNLIINGAMQVAQRGTSFSSSGYNLDRFGQDNGRSNTVTRVKDAPEGFVYSHKTSGGTQGRQTWTSVELPEAGEAGVFYNGATLTVSFYAKADAAQDGLLDIAFSDEGRGTSNEVKIQNDLEYSLTTEWKRYSFTFTVGVDPAATNDCVYLMFACSDNSSVIYLTGVQLELGKVATPFEHRSYGEELALCQRYYQLNPVVLGFWTSATDFRQSITFPVQMRTAPTASIINGNGYHEHMNLSGYTGISNISFHAADKAGSDFRCVSSSNRGRLYGDPSKLDPNVIAFDAEL